MSKQTIIWDRYSSTESFSFPESFVFAIYDFHQHQLLYIGFAINELPQIEIRRIQRRLGLSSRKVNTYLGFVENITSNSNQLGESFHKIHQTLLKKYNPIFNKLSYNLGNEYLQENLNILLNKETHATKNYAL